MMYNSLLVAITDKNNDYSLDRIDKVELTHTTVIPGKLTT